MTVRGAWRAGAGGLIAAGVLGLAPDVQAQAMFNTAIGVVRAPVVSLRDMPFRTVIRQQYDYSCGSAALATLLKHHYGRRVDEAQVFQAMFATGDQAKIQRVGFSLLDMKRYLESQGLEADGYRMSLADLQRWDRPGIALIQTGPYRHFVVVKGVRNGRILVGDPNRGLKLYRTEEFTRVWNGVLFSLHAQGGFNAKTEWASLQFGPVERLDERSLSGLTRVLPPIYQVTPRISGGGG